ncbi:MAG: PEP-CTERM sorting domain-containing protein [Oscillatoriales cyanobacterium RM2_1_1]|nr:PEP-CTERM sorting domain-containing protein [Oscillatoriales cyanobacterium SM2_3_0]NJO44751.1 PEP-CTERM sorting domain-containing protein [Oscillatoriales cyanobacterium RM2_1_1]
MTNSNIVKLSVGLVGAALVTVVGGQAAEAVTINFAGGDPANGSVGFSDYTTSGLSTAGTQSVVQSANGLGVLGGGLDSPQIDGLGPDETLRLSFTNKVTLTSIGFARVFDAFLPFVGRVNDEFQLFVDGVSVFSGDIPGGNFLDTATGTLGPISFTGKQFDFTVTDNTDAYFLASVEVVPEPLTILGSLSAVGIGTALKKRQAKRNLKG